MVKENKTRRIILAPHIDDEVIGCFTLLRNEYIDCVLYFFEKTKQRMKEAKASGKTFGFEPKFVTTSDFKKHILPDDIIIVPNINDSHHHHKVINCLAKALPNKKQYYSIDMNVLKITLHPTLQNEKRKLLNDLFPSQKELFNQNMSYWLFESILHCDYEKTINVKTQFEGFHYYNCAPTEVSFLKHRHRHMFFVNVEIEVFHNDREIEFLMFKGWLDKYITKHFKQKDNIGSCEMVAQQILEAVINEYPQRNVVVEVSEDNENGAKVKYNY